jgi:hypothetical protein
MNKILLSGVILLGGYISYTAIFSDKDGADKKSLVDLEQTVVIDKSSLQQTPELKDIAPFENNEEHLDGTYTLNIKSDLAETNQEFVFTSDNKFKQRRYVVSPGSDQRDSTTIGTYSIEKNTITLTFESERDLDIFPEDIIILTMKRSGNLKYGPFELVKE